MESEFIQNIYSSLIDLGALPQDRFLIALSGGGDSTALILAMCDIAAKDNLVAAHLDHNVRSGSGKDREKVEKLCRDLDVECISQTLNKENVEEERKRHGSLEGALRTLRYRFLEDASVRGGVDWILTGHTSNDQAETAIFRIVRNMNWRSLAAIPTKRGKILRPMLGISGLKAREFCRSNGVQFLDDPSNLENSFTRNRIRNSTIPALIDSFHSNLEDLSNRMVSAATGLLTAENVLIKSLFTQEVSQNTPSLNLFDLQNLPEILQEGAVLSFLEKGLTEYPSTSLLKNIMQFLIPGGSGSLDLPGGLLLRVAYGKAVILPEKMLIQGMPENSMALSIPGRTQFPGSDISIVAEHGRYQADMQNFPAGTAFLSAVKTGKQLWARRRKPGDKFMPLGMENEKKVKDLLIDRKVPVDKRDSVPVVLDSGGNIVWVGGVEVSQKAALEKVIGEEIIILKLEDREWENGK